MGDDPAATSGRWRVHHVLLVLVLLAVTLLGWLRVSRPALLEPWDWLWYDRMAERDPGASALEPYVVILVDDESLDVLGERWPISRARWAELLGVLAQARPAVVALDVWFETPEPVGALELVENLLDDLDTLPDEVVGEGARALAARTAAELPFYDGNRRLVEAIASAGTVVLGLACVDRAHAVGVAPTPDWLVAQGRARDELPPIFFHCADLSSSYSELGASALRNAGVNLFLEPDGRARRYPLYFAFQDRVFPSMANAVVEVAGANEGEAIWVLKEDGGSPLFRPFDPADLATLSLVDVLDASAGGSLEPLLAGKRVFVGVSALGTRDTVDMPGYTHIPAIYTHVMAAVNLDQGTLVRARSSALTWSVVIAILGLVVLAFVSTRMRVPYLALVGVLSCALSLWLAHWMLERGVLITLVPWWSGVVGLVMVTLGVRLVVARREREEMGRIRGAFQHYVAPEVIDELMKDRDRLRLGGERREITAFFADIVGFTGIAERTEPAELVVLLNEVLSTVANAVIACGGIVDKFMGDSTVAMFGAPIEQPDHACRACRVALACQDEVARVRERWKERGMPGIHVRIGLNTGAAVVGNIGSHTRFDFTMLGDAVNLAARLESINNIYKTAILVGPGTYEAARESFLFREIDQVQVKGKGQAVTVYEPLAEDDDSDEAARARTLIERYQEALALYRERSFEEARERFDALARDGDGPSHEMAARAARFAETPPPDDWDAIFVSFGK